ncbi:MAG TPA: glutamate 5-kinase [Thermogutta sp.]|nr:glutamate 5-kinase [Thermogutta sp.]HOP76665.1 glutamate 5-kinase [Thermogutta sp.]HPU05806.1 glutamate 5-kinase [Thermogutta sp.]HQF13331.1 glutamate 5-kinase [Thermogutta sp.]
MTIDLVRQEIATEARLIVVKVGTRVVTHPDGRLNYERIEQLAEEIHCVRQTGRKVVLVSSGAVGAGVGRLGLPGRPTDLSELQAVAAIGQSLLVEAYDQTFRRYNDVAAQVLLTADVIENRTSYLNARNTLLALLNRFDAVPIINENDTVAVEELRMTFGDNDRLAALVTNLLQAQLLVLLSDVEGLYSGDPNDPKSELIPLVRKIDDSIFDLVRDKKTGLSKGGMASKLKAAQLVTTGGGNVIIASGKTPGVLKKIIAGEVVGTLFFAKGPTVAARKRWFGLSIQPRGQLIVDAGAREAIEKRGKSLLPIGILDVVGQFQKGDLVALRDPDGCEFGKGLSNYSAEDVRRIKGLRTRQIAQVLGWLPYEEVIHRDNLLVTRP